MSSEWTRVPTLRHERDDLGPYGLMVAEAAWRMCAAHETDDITPFWNPANVAAWTRLDRLRADEAHEKACHGMLECQAAGIVASSRGRIVVRGWRKYVVRSSSSDRVRRHRQKQTRPHQDTHPSSPEPPDDLDSRERDSKACNVTSRPYVTLLGENVTLSEHHVTPTGPFVTVTNPIVAFSDASVPFRRGRS